VRLPGPLLVVTDRHQAARPLPALVGAIAAAGARWIWLRDRDLPEDERASLARALADVLAPRGGTLTVGADVALAEAVGAQGVHLRTAGAVAEARARLGAAALIGVSAHGLAEVRAARDAGADYATLSPIFATASKPGYGPALGLAGLAEAAALGLPLLALGGIEAGHAAACRRAGAAGLAAMGGVMRAADPAAQVRGLIAAFSED
jgi:thiamine-phosphate pyrophosphorylase